MIVLKYLNSLIFKWCVRSEENKQINEIWSKLNKMAILEITRQQHTPPDWQVFIGRKQRHGYSGMTATS